MAELIQVKDLRTSFFTPEGEVRAVDGVSFEIGERKTLEILDQPSAPLLFINGKNDDQHPVEDIYLAMEHGDPKEARIFADGGHMGRVPGQKNDEALAVATGWLKRKLTQS